jgi:predicted RNA-binding protein with EMAP domain
VFIHATSATSVEQRDFPKVQNQHYDRVVVLYLPPQNFTGLIIAIPKGFVVINHYFYPTPGGRYLY